MSRCCSGKKQRDHPFFLESVYEVYLNGSYLNLEQNYYK